MRRGKFEIVKIATDVGNEWDWYLINHETKTMYRVKYRKGMV